MFLFFGFGFDVGSSFLFVFSFACSILCFDIFFFVCVFFWGRLLGFFVMSYDFLFGFVWVCFFVWFVLLVDDGPPGDKFATGGTASRLRGGLTSQGYGSLGIFGVCSRVFHGFSRVFHWFSRVFHWFSRVF